MFAVLIAIGIDLSSVLLGAELSAGMAIGSAIGAVMIGSFLLAIFSTACALVGASTHLSTSMIVRFVFGEYGAKIFSLMIGVSLLGWYGVQVGFFASNAASILDGLFGVSVPTGVLSAIGGILMMTTAIVGYRAIERLSVWSVPLLLGLMLLTLGMGLYRGDLSGHTPNGAVFTIGAAVSYVISIFIVGSTISPDIARWAKNRKEAAISTFLGIFLGNSFMIVVAILLSTAMNSDDMMKIFVALGLGIPGILVLTLAQWTTNTSNLYSSSLGFSVLLRRVPKIYITIALGLIATMLAVLGIYEKFFTFLNYLAIGIAPIGGIYAAEFFVVRRNLRADKLTGKPDQVVFRSLITWAIGIIVTYLTTPAGDGTVVLTLTTAPSVDGFLTGFIVQSALGLLAVLLMRRKSSQVTAISR